MSLDVYMRAVREITIFHLNFPTRYKPIAERVGILDYIWDPYKLGISKAEQLIQPLEIGLGLLDAVADSFAQDTIEGFTSYVSMYLEACQQNPDAAITAAT
jgi:hypothetical protein